jgi:hypothetical protein
MALHLAEISYQPVEKGNWLALWKTVKSEQSPRATSATAAPSSNPEGSRPLVTVLRVKAEWRHSNVAKGFFERPWHWQW